MTSIVAFDPGANAAKARAQHGTIVLPSTIAVNGQVHVHGLAGLRSRKRPPTICTALGDFLVGAGAHDFGRPVENLDFERLTGSPEMRALFYGTLSRLFVDEVPAELTLLVGLPIAAMTGEQAPETIRRVKAFFVGEHSWQADGHPHQTTVAQVQVTGQPVGALFEYFLMDDGAIHPARRADYKRDVGILNLGMSTVDLLSSRQGQIVERLTGGETLGVQDMLSEMSRQSGYTLAELDEQLRDGRLDLSLLLPIWERRVFGYLDKVWGSTQRRFARVIATGGGTFLLHDALLRRFGARLYVAEDPVLATAIGLYRFGVKQIRKAV